MFRDSCDGHKNLGDFIPCPVVHDPGDGKAEYGLEFHDGTPGILSEDAVGNQGGDGSIYRGDGIQLLLHLPYFRPAGAYGQFITGPGGRDAADLFRRINIHIVSVIIPYDIYGAVPLLSQRLASPLGHPVRAGDSFAVTVLGKNRLLHIRPGQVAAENLIYDQTDTFKYIPAVDPFLVVGRGGGNGKFVAAVPVPRNHHWFGVAEKNHSG